MGQNLDLSMGKVHMKAPLTKTNTEKRSNKCNKCEYAPIHEGNLGRHLKTHSGEKPNKCNQCEFASSQASN